MGMDVDPTGNGSPYILDGSRISNTSCMVVDEVTLELRDLFIRQYDFGELTNTGVYAIHGLTSLDLTLHHGAAGKDPFECLRM